MPQPVNNFVQSIFGRVATAARQEVDRYAQWAQGMLRQAQGWPAVAAQGVTCACRLVTPHGPALCRMPGIGMCGVCGVGVCVDHAYLNVGEMVCSGCVAALKGQHPGAHQQAPKSQAPRLTREQCLKTLGLPRDAHSDDIRDRYRALVKRHHPDRARSEEDRQKRELKMRDLNAAYRALTATQQ